MSLNGFDYSTGRITGAAASAKNYSFVCRYLSTKGNPKNLKPEELADFVSNGIMVVLVFEQWAENAYQGDRQGRVDAKGANDLATALGLGGAPIYFGVDFPASQAQIQTVVDEYLQGVAAVIGPQRVGVYGDYSVVSYVLNNNLATYAWQTFAWSKAMEARCHIYQYQNDVFIEGLPPNVSVDLDRTVVSDVDFGQATSLPVVTHLDPSSGSINGGDSITISGSGFSGVTAVSFGSSAGSNLAVISDSQLTVTSPIATVSGSVDVTVTAPAIASAIAASGVSAIVTAGRSAISAADQFTYGLPSAPVVTRVDPRSGSAAGGDTVTVAGSGFTGVTGVQFGSVAATVVDAAGDPIAGTIAPASPDTQVVVSSPPNNVAGSVHVTVTTQWGTSVTSTDDQFTYAGS